MSYLKISIHFQVGSDRLYGLDWIYAFAMEKQLRIIGFIIDIRNGPQSDINYVPF